MSERRLCYCVVWVAVVVYLLAVLPLAAQDSANAILEKVDRVRTPSGSFVMQVTITTQHPGKADQVNVYDIYAQDTTKTLVRFVSPPAERGKALLMVEHELWIFIPNIGKPLRVSLAQRLVGDVANGDVARLNFAGDYDATVDGTEVVNGAERLILTLTAKTRGLTYGKVRLWVAKDTYHPLQAEFFALSGALLKVGRYENYAVISGQLRPTLLVLVDKMRTGMVSTLEYREIKPQEIPPQFFNKNYLKDLE
jgi:outer membrane lipoprotein-sorting protein